MNSGRLRVFALWMADVACVASVWALVVNLYQMLGFGSYYVSYYWSAWPVPILFTFINVFAKLYHGHLNYPAMPVPPVEEFRRLVLSSLATHLLVMAYLGFSHEAIHVSRFVLIASGILVAALAQVFRDAVRWVLAKLNVGYIPVYLAGDGLAARAVAQALAHDRYYGLRIVRTFARESAEEIVDAAQGAGIKHLIACYRDSRVFSARFRTFSSWFTFIEYVPTAEAFPVADARAVQMGGIGGLEMVNQHRMKLMAIEKSVLDRALALLIFICALPAFVIMPILIKLTSKGPVFYRAKRLGKCGRTIYVWKFRSMFADADKRLVELLASDSRLAAEFKADFKLKKDPRITPIGRFMRKTSIDELPQLFNVFTHDMALIGPRPIVAQEVPKYGRHYAVFSSVKPGITGLWQASGRNNTDYDARVALDVHYVLNWSPWMDIWIVFKTAISVLTMRGSY